MSTMFIRNRVLFSLLKPHTSSHFSSSSTLHPPSSRHSATTADATKATIKEELKQAGGWFTTLAKSKANIIIGGTVGLLGLNFMITRGASWWYTRQVGSSLSHGILPPPSSTAYDTTTVIANTPPTSTSPATTSSSDEQQQVRDYYRRSLVDRPELHTQIKDILNPKIPTRFFHIITGRPGTGKTTAVLRCCRDLKGGRGMGYINVDPVSRNFGKDLGETFNFRMEEHLNIFNVISQITLGSKVAETPKKDPLSMLRRAAGALHDAAAVYKNMTGKPFILVIDSTERLLHSSSISGDASSSSDNGQLLTALLQYAEQWAEEGVVICVFIASDADTMEKLRGSYPTSSRVAHPPLMVRDLTRTQSTTLLSHYGITDDVYDDDSNTEMQKKKKSNATTTTPSLAGKCLDLSGGSLLLLERCAGIINALRTNTGTTNDEVIGHHVETNMMSLVRGAYKAAGLLDATPHQQAGLSVIKALLELPAPIFDDEDDDDDDDDDDTNKKKTKKKNGLAASKWRELIPNVDHQNKLLREGGGVLEFDGERVRFSSRLARVYAERELRGVVSREAAEELDGGKRRKKKKWW